MKEIVTFSKDDKYAIGCRITELRQKKGYKSIYVADCMDIDRSTYSGIENGRSKLSAENLYKLCQIYKVSADYILFGETEDSCLAEIRDLLKKQKPDMARKIVAGLKAMFA